MSKSARRIPAALLWQGSGMAYLIFKYQCKACGHTWEWGYVFVPRCPKCKTCHSFNQAVVSPDGWAAEERPMPADRPAEKAASPSPPAGTPSKNQQAANRNGGYSPGASPLGRREDVLPIATP